MASTNSPGPKLRLYRGLSSIGIAEGQGTADIYGEQYLPGGCSVLENDVGLLEACRPWLTVDWTGSDFATIGEQFEAWSYFHYDQYTFVARVCGAGSFNNRLAFFGHAWAWTQQELANGADPGLYIGNSSAFDAPWRDRKDPPPPSAPPPPEVVRPAQVLAEAKFSGTLLAYLHDAMTGRLSAPVVLATDLSRFKTGDALPAIVSFACAALPSSLKQRCSVRIFTRNPTFYIGQASVNLVVLPEDQAAAALNANRDAVLLDGKGRRVEGKNPSDIALRYAEWVLTCFSNTELQSSLPAFALRMGRHIEPDRPPTLKQMGSTTIVYRLAHASGDSSRLDALLPELMEGAAANDPGLGWDDLISEEEWNSISPSVLIQKLALYPNASTEPQRALQDKARAVADRRRMRIQEELAERYLNALNRQDVPANITALLANHLFDELVARSVVRRHELAPARLVNLEDRAAHVLRHLDYSKYKSSEFAPHFSDLAKYPLSAQCLVAATTGNELTSEWALHAVANWELEELREKAVLGLIAKEANSFTIWYPVLDSFLKKLLSAPQMRQEEYRHFNALFQGIDKYRTTILGGRLVFELEARADIGLGDGVISERGKELAERERSAPLSPADQRFLTEKALDPQWVTLGYQYLVSLDGRLLCPQHWLAHIGDLILENRFCRARLSEGELLGLWESKDRSNTTQVFEEIDRRVVDDGETIGRLIACDRWQAWRGNTQLGAAERRKAAMSWCSAFLSLQSASKQQGSGRDKASAERLEPRLEDWNRIVEDLGSQRVDVQELKKLASDRSNQLPFPTIAWFEINQCEHIVRLCGPSVDALVFISERMSNSELCEPLEAVNLCVGWSELRTHRIKPSGLIRLWTSPAAIPIERLKVSEANLLFRHCDAGGATRSKAGELRRKCLYDDLSSDFSNSLDWGRAESMLGELWVKLVLLKILKERVLTDSQIRQLEQSVPDDSDPLPEADRREAREIAEELRERLGLRRLPAYLSEEIGQRIADEKLAAEIVEALDSPSYASQRCWDVLENKQDWPAWLTALIQKKIAERRSMDGFGDRAWPIFRAALKDNRGLVNYCGDKLPLPALRIAGILSPSIPFGSLACDIIRLSYRTKNEEWWHAVFLALRERFPNRGHDFELALRRISDFVESWPAAEQLAFAKTRRVVMPDETREVALSWLDINRTSDPDTQIVEMKSRLDR
jgi:hypothetical protein